MNFDKWEYFCDGIYYQKWALRPIGIRNFYHTAHVETKEEAETIVNTINKMYDEYEKLHDEYRSLEEAYMDRTIR